MFNKSLDSYCKNVSYLKKNNIHRLYHDNQYGFRIIDDNELFGRLILEINQAGLSWETILKKQKNFKRAFSGYSIKKIANYDENDITRLLNDSSIIRNRLKVNSIIFNAKKIQMIQSEFSSFYKWLLNHQRKDLKDWTLLFKQTFKFTGKEITKEFLLSTGIIEGAHDIDCPIFNKINF